MKVLVKIPYSNPGETTTKIRLSFPFVIRKIWGYREDVGLKNNPNQIYAFPTLNQPDGFGGNVYSSLDIGFVAEIGNRTTVALEMTQSAGLSFSIFLIIDAVDSTFKVYAETLTMTSSLSYADFYAFPYGGYYGRVDL